MTVSAATPQQEPSSRNRTIRSIELSPFLSDLIVNIGTEFLLLLEILWAIVSQPIFDEAVLGRLSISLLCCHQVNTFLESCVVNFPMVDLSESLSNYWVLGVPLMLSTTIAMLVSLPYLWRPYEETLVITAMVAMFCMDALLPLIIFLGSWLLVTGQVEMYSGVGILALSWFVIKATTHWIRCSIYQQMGHG